MLVDFSTVKTVAGAPRLCQQCGAFFIQYRHTSAQKRCPTCTDLHQLRPQVVQERELIAEYDGVRISSLPAEWTSKPAKSSSDDDFFQIDIRGRDIAPADYTGAWSGRITLYADYPHGASTELDDGAVVKIRHMRVRELVLARYYEYKTKDGSVVTRRKTMPFAGETPTEIFPAAIGKDADAVPIGTVRAEWQEREYLFLARTQAPAVRELRYILSGDVAYGAEHIDFQSSVSAGHRLHTLAIVHSDQMLISDNEDVFLGPDTLVRLNSSVDEFKNLEVEDYFDEFN